MAIYLEAKHGGIVLRLLLDDKVCTINFLGGLRLINLEIQMLTKGGQ